MANHTKSRGAGRNLCLSARQSRWVERMQRLRLLVRVTSDVWEALLTDLRKLLVRGVVVVGLVFVGLPVWITEVIR